jgi:hypothetical protein
MMPITPRLAILLEHHRRSEAEGRNALRFLAFRYRI